MAKDMTRGSIWKLIVGFAIPMLLGDLFQQFYNMVDTMVVGKFVNMEALAAVGAVGTLTSTIIGFATGLTSGFGIIVAQRFGAGDEEGLRKSYAMSIGLTAVISIVITFLGIGFADPILKAMNTPADTFAYARTYLVIVFTGMLANVFYSLLSGVLRALGDSKAPLCFLIISSVLNVVLDLVFTISCGMEVAGVALATVISQAVSALLSLLYIAKKYDILRLHREDWRADGVMIRSLVRLGLPGAFQYSVTGLGMLLVQSVVNSFGSTIMAAYTAASKVEILFSQPMCTFGITMKTYAGQNLGAGKIDRIKKGVRTGLILSVVSGILGALGAIFFGRPVLSLFVTGEDVAVIDAAQHYLNIVAPPFLILALLFIYTCTLQGLGNAIIPMTSGFIELGIRILVAFTLAQPALLGYTGICLATPLAWVGSTTILAISYYRDISRLSREKQAEQMELTETTA